jgi:methionine-rich copper-binding protein CopC
MTKRRRRLDPASRSTSERACALLTALVLAAFVLPADAIAHAKLIRARPAPSEVLTTAPTHVQLWFNERLEDEFSAIEVTDQTGRRVERGPARVSPDDRTTLVVALDDLSSGSYIVSWRILSVDGHPARGRLRFSVR